MKKTVLLSILSACVGAVLAVMLIDPPDPARNGVAQEPPGESSTIGGSPPRMAISIPGTARNAPAPAADDLTPEERVNIAVYEDVNRSVVNINTKSVRSDDFFFLEVPEEGAGSGIVIDREGHILTNFHVVEGAREVRVTLFNSRAFEAKAIGVDPPTDLAVLKIDAPTEMLHPVTFGDSTLLQVGQRAYAIGNPFGLERTLSIGVISSLNRDLRTRRVHLKQLIQIDADINPGNSGGPLLDSRGRMIGMNTVIASSTGQSAGVGFAIPVNTIARIVPELLEHGHVVRPDIGIDRVFKTDDGLLIVTLTQGGAAERAGLRGFQYGVRRSRLGPVVFEEPYVDGSAADLIVGVDGQRVHTVDDFLAIIESKKPGDQVTVNVVREGRRVDVPVTLDAGG